MVQTAVIASTAMAIDRRPDADASKRPDDAVIDPTFAISIDMTSGMTVMRMRLTKIVPIGVAIASTGPAAVEPTSA